MVFTTKPVTVVSEEEGKDIKTPMMLNEYIAMSIANELINPDSRLASDDFTVSKDLVIQSMENHGYNDVAFPNYHYFGVSMSGGKGKTRKIPKKHRQI